MAKMFYSAKEAAEKLGLSEAEFKELVRKGTLREFRDAGTVNYKADEIDAIAAKMQSAASAAGASATGEIVLEPVDDSGIDLASSAGEILTLEEVDAGDTATGMRSASKKKEGTAVPSVGVNVFDDEDLDEMVDPLAQTAVTDVGGLGLEGTGSGSGILDLTRESDDTSLGAELLEEIYTGDEQPADEVEMGEATRAGLDEAITDSTEEGADPVSVETAGGPKVTTRQVIEYGPDPVSSALTAAMVVAVLVFWFAGLAVAGLVRGVLPAVISGIYDHLGMYSGAVLVVTVIAAGAGFLVSKRSA